MTFEKVKPSSPILLSAPQGLLHGELCRGPAKARVSKERASSFPTRWRCSSPWRLHQPPTVHNVCQHLDGTRTPGVKTRQNPSRANVGHNAACELGLAHPEQVVEVVAKPRGPGSSVARPARPVGTPATVWSTSMQPRRPRNGKKNKIHATMPYQRAQPYTTTNQPTMQRCLDLRSQSSHAPPPPWKLSRLQGLEAAPLLRLELSSLSSFSRDSVARTALIRLRRGS